MPRIRSRRLACLSGLAALLTVAAAQPAFAEGGFELVARDTGIAGGTPLPVELPYVGPGVITNDGRYAYFTLVVDHGTWSTKQGLYRRDLTTKTSTLLVPGHSVQLTGITADEKTLSFTTKDRLSTSDKNSLADVYTYSLATGAVSLVSRANGASGLATGILNAGYVSRNGLTAVWDASTGIMKRSLAAGTTTLVPGTSGSVVGGYLEYQVRPDQSASADGSVFVIVTSTGGAIVTPTRQLPWPADTNNMRVNAAGTMAVAAINDQSPKLAIVDPASGNVRTVDFSATAPTGASMAGFSSDGTKALLWRYNTASAQDLVSVDLATGAGTARGLTIYANGTISDNGNFALAGGGFATAATGNALPGGIDPPSPATYLSMTRGCRGGFLTSTTAPNMTVSFPTNAVVPAITSATVTTWSGTNPKPTIHTLTATGTFKLSVGVTPYRLQADLKLADGRTITETWSQPSETSQCALIL